MTDWKSTTRLPDLAIRQSDLTFAGLDWQIQVDGLDEHHQTAGFANPAERVGIAGFGNPAERERARGDRTMYSFRGTNEERILFDAISSILEINLK